ncbi:hypothetical protein [Piscinibacter gummiphilus]|uniref:Lysozyme inhibitor LprI N-terminal domain-containing protein n=1 Tax=Piscinibacter gummiphilus TaxID=946333 RepID=A0ABZ0CWN0_9BURK|nr:hypothetical protein [Piscinibacter gummiphilus]WOB06899.1 hypothetical protein RXV79_18475 [Piscinibacter gummiphilus]
MKLGLLLPILMVGLSLNAASATSEAENPDVGAALGTLEAKNGIDTHYKFCRGMAGEQGYQYDYAKYIWELKNRPYIALSEQVFKDLPASSAAAIKQRWKRSAENFDSVRASAGANQNGTYCAQHFSQIMDGSGYNMSASRTTLAHLLGTREEVRVLERNIDMEVGCVKGAYNRGIKQFEELRRACDCQTTKIIGKMSSGEIDSYLQLVAENKGQEAMALVTKRVAMSELQACYSRIRTQ